MEIVTDGFIPVAEKIIIFRCSVCHRAIPTGSLYCENCDVYHLQEEKP